MSVTVHHGDCLDVLRGMGEASVDSVVTDPPYHLTGMKGGGGSSAVNPTNRGQTSSPYSSKGGFMGCAWDGGDVAFKPETWAEVLRVMKPGAHLVAFGSTRGYHRMVCAIEDAGFEVRDQLAWLYGSGFPKSLDVGKAIDKAAGRASSFITAPATSEAAAWQGWGTALKPAHEPIVLARKPLACPTVAAQVLATGTGALNVDGCRVATGDAHFSRPASHGGEHEGWDRPWKHTPEGCRRRQASKDQAAEKAAGLGRWPANLCHDGSPEVLEAFEKFGSRRSAGLYPSDSEGTGEGVTYMPTKRQGQLYKDAGTAARFFPALGFGEDELRFHYSAKASKAERAGSRHPTIKPLALMRWLCRLVTPPGGTVLDCFAGTGVTGEAALLEGFGAVLVEREAEHVADIRRRLGRARGGDAPLFAESAA